MSAKDSVKLKGVFTVYKFDDPDGSIAKESQAGESAEWLSRKHKGSFRGKSSTPSNLGLNNGITRLLTLLIGGGGTSFANASARLGVGDSSTAAAANQTGLQAGANYYYQLADSTYPQVSAQTVTCQATFTGTHGNFAWNEFGMDNDGTDGSGTSTSSYSGTAVCMLDRVVSTQGSKTSGQTWILTLTIGVS